MALAACRETAGDALRSAQCLFCHSRHHRITHQQLPRCHERLPLYSVHLLEPRRLDRSLEVLSPTCRSTAAIGSLGTRPRDEGDVDRPGDEDMAASYRASIASCTEPNCKRP